MSQTLKSKIDYIRQTLNSDFGMVLSPKWGASEPNHRLEIRHYLSSQFSSRFSRQQLSRLNDLNWIPETSDGYICISHCRSTGGFSFAMLKHGFDVEETSRISTAILKRTCTADELAECPRTEFLWVAKEAGFKALAAGASQLLISDLICIEWKSHFENQVFSFRLKSEKTLDFELNRGFIFLDAEKSFGYFFR